MATEFFSIDKAAAWKCEVILFHPAEHTFKLHFNEVGRIMEIFAPSVIFHFILNWNRRLKTDYISVYAILTGIITSS